eukprot:NODE_3406_length_1357_cov_44.590762_g2968_i0.p1 GENE.NODE_3406_length_1357_cov_44.590762_g2968_i0~~NODE_3406_length_1357_cov_44.590762_g2968_i0.p1  ORF type:complete len:113 (+),score=10.84 NODE_3406_length_1357_cov_44.590762_g2968_i0:499-837(+)
MKTNCDLKAKCDICDENHEAIYRCLQCEQNLCESMVKVHRNMKVSKDHKIISIHELVSFPTSETEIVRILCSEHKEPFKLFDEDCQRLICNLCWYIHSDNNGHQGHKCINLQ